jgi:ABC-type tungstate transport system substrate-binding protein
MTFLLDGLRQAWHLLVSGDPYLWHLVWVTLKVAFIPTAIAVVIGVPIATALGIGRFRGRGFVLALANAGLGLPPVLVGIVLAVLMFPRSPLGSWHLLFTLKGVYLAQTLLALPIIVALSATAMERTGRPLLAQARALGAGRRQLAWLAISESRVGILAAVITAIGSGLSEVAAVVLVGGNIEGTDQTLASAALEQVDAGHFSNGIAIGILLLGLILLVSGALTLAQHRNPADVRA